MNKLKSNLAAKITAVLLFMLFLAAMLGGIVGVVYMENEGYYASGPFSFYNTGCCAGITSGYANTVYYEYLPLALKQAPSSDDSWQLKQYQEKFSPDNTNFFFTVTDKEGKVLLTNYEQQNYGTQKTYGFAADEQTYDEDYFVNAYVKDPITAQDDYYLPYQLSLKLYPLCYTIIVTTAISTVLTILLFLFLLCAAGHRKGEERIILNTADKLPFDLYALGLFSLGTCLVWACDNILWGSVSGLWTGIIMGVTALMLAGGALALALSFATRVKAGQWWQNTIIYKTLRLVGRLLRSMGNAGGCLLANLPLLWKIILLFGCYCFINVIAFVVFMDSGGEALFFLLGLLFNLAVLLGLCFIMLQLNKLKQGGEKIAAGDYSCKIDTKNMFWDLKKHAEALNNIRLGMSKAVEESLKSERLKTELITNVSHDIKTPLTSIVNYVDLLKKEPIANDHALEYIEVLDRQSARLRKLTEDLVEAAKASTGNVAVNLDRLDVVEFLNQSLGEYAERFSAGCLEAIIRTPQNEAAIWADGRLLWRVFDNLLNNICKYSLAHTRVYFDVTNTEEEIIITLKNISRVPLNITADELMERFVRGDSARTTEGSGLGLSIAKSLTELQQGSFRLSVDGDLFKVIISFKSVN